MKNALIIFVRKPELGKVKTRLAATVGHEKALDIYKELLLHTFTVAQSVNADKHVFYHGEIQENDCWNAEGFTKHLQVDADLGGKMRHAFETVFALNYERYVIIGSDCLQLTAGIIEDAFASLDQRDTVIGPARDGGYYLLGMRQMYPFLFENIEWSTAHVFAATMACLERHALKPGLLPALIDVDTEADWLASKQ